MPGGVITPEAVLLELPTAGVATRAFARLIDLFIQLVAAVILLFGVGVLINFGLSPVLGVLAGMVTVLLVVPIATEILLRGASVGKLILGLRVVSRDGSPSTPRQATVRGLVAIVDIYASLGFLAAVSAMLSPQSQRLGDLAAGTVVIRERNRSLTAVPIAFYPPPGMESYVASLDVRSLGDEDFSLIRSFLLRVKQLEPAARRDLAMRLAEGVRSRIHHTLPGPVDPELWLVCVASAFQQRDGNLLADAALGLAPLAPVAQPAPVASPPAAPPTYWAAPRTPPAPMEGPRN